MLTRTVEWSGHRWRRIGDGGGFWSARRPMKTALRNGSLLDADAAGREEEEEEDEEEEEFLIEK